MTAEILIVEDDRPILSLLMRMVERAGYAVSGEADGGAALDYLREHQPDLVMLDLSLGCPISGVDLLRYVGQAPHLAATMVVVLSANPQLPPDLYHTNRIARIIAKPVRPSDITATIDTLLRERA